MIYRMNTNKRACSNVEKVWEVGWESVVMRQWTRPVLGAAAGVSWVRVWEQCCRLQVRRLTKNIWGEKNGLGPSPAAWIGR